MGCNHLQLPQKEEYCHSKKGAKKDDKYAGAYVKEPIPGSYDWVVSFDLNSLYPHLIMQYNISPETLVDEPHPRCSVDKILSGTFIADGRYATAANGAMYRKDVRDSCLN